MPTPKPLPLEDVSPWRVTLDDDGHLVRVEVWQRGTRTVYEVSDDQHT